MQRPRKSEASRVSAGDAEGRRVLDTRCDETDGTFKVDEKVRCSEQTVRYVVYHMGRDMVSETSGEGSGIRWGVFGETHTSLPGSNWPALCLPQCGIACFPTSRLLLSSR